MKPIYKDWNIRFGRQESIPGWSQAALSTARVLVAGSDALGNETLKNLVLLGIGSVTIVDRDVVEQSNLCRSVLFRDEDIGQPKAYAAARNLRLLNPAAGIEPFHLDLTTDVMYPAQPPFVTMLSPLLHPHLWPNGVFCLGTWKPSEKLDSLLHRVATILCFDPAAINWRSVADDAAASWARANQHLLPLDRPFPAAVSSDLFQ